MKSESRRRFLVVLLVVHSRVDATSDFPNPTPAGKSWAPCAFAVDQLTAEGNGSTYGSCLFCSPTSATCPPKCQPLIDALYHQCDGVYAPQDAAFDAAHTLRGVFNDHMDVLRVAAARCGCSTASRIGARVLTTVIFTAVVAILNAM